MNDLLFYTDTTAHPVIAAPAYPGDAGYDLAVSKPVCIQAKSFQKVQLDLFVAIPAGYVGVIKDRSGHASGGLHILGGVIDASYRGRVGHAVRLDSGADERGEYVRVALVKAESVTVFGERR